MNTSTLVVAPVYIGAEEIEVLNDIKNRCFYPSIKERQRFFKKVCESVGASEISRITEDDFETAFNVAIGILQRRGEDILNGRHTDNLAMGLFIHGR